MAGNGSERIVAYCGLVCSECGAFRKSKCEGCYSEKRIFKKCPVRKCAIDRSYTTCAQCSEFEDLKRCRKLNNFISKIMGFIFRTDRIANLCCIREVGIEKFRTMG